MEKNKMKNSGIDWIGEIPESWEVRKWKFDLKIQMWFPAESKLFDNNKGFPLIRIRDLKESKIETYYKWKFPKDSIVKKWNHLVWMDWDFHSVLWNNEDAILNQRIMKIEVGKNLNSKYFYYMLFTPLKIINDITYATTVKHLSDSDIKEVFLVLPYLQTQQKISSFLDSKTLQIEKLIEKDKKLIELLKERRVSLINKVVTKGLDDGGEMKDSWVEWIGEIPEDWEVRKLKHLTKQLLEETQLLKKMNC